MAIICAAVFTASAAVCNAQERTTLRRVEIVGLQRLSPDQVITASGLKVGDSVDRSMIDDAAEKLMRSGWFASVDYRVNTADSDTTVIFEVREKTTPTGAASGDALGLIV